MSELPCRTCDHKAGLSILLVRPTAIATDATFAPAEANRLLTHEASVKALGLPRLHATRHALRMLRRGGFVYAWYTQKPRQLAKAWQVFRVHGSGALVPESQISWSDEKSSFACSKKASHPHDVRTLCIQLPVDSPESAGPVWIGFSMNWWDDAIRQRVQADPSAAGMVKIDPLTPLGGVPNAFKADAMLIQQHVADFALRSIDHGGIKKGINVTEGGTEPGTPFYNRDDDKTYGQARDLAGVMQRQAAGHPLTANKAFVLALPDPVGLTADLNGIRFAKDRANQQEWNRNDDWVRSEACHTTLEGLRKSLIVAGMLQSREWGSRASEKEWKSLQGRGVPYEWRPDANGAYAVDGSRAGHMKPVGPEAARIGDRIESRGRMLGERHWRKISDELNMERYRAWPAQRADIDRQLADTLAPYETDWLSALDGEALRAYFKHHFNEHDAGKLTARVSSGLIYASEGDLAHFPQPFTAQHTERWTGLILEPDITEPRAIALRAMFGNQKSVIDKVHAILIGKADRAEGDGRDKTYDLLKGILTHELGQRLNWLHPVIVSLSAGGLAASAAGVVQLLASGAGRSPAPPSGSLKKYLALLPRLTAAQQQLELAVEATRSSGKIMAAPSVTLLLKTRVDVPTALAVLNGYQPKGQPAIVVAHGNTVELQVVTDVETALAVQEGRIKAGQVPGQRVSVAPTSGMAARNLEEMQMRMSRLPVDQPLTPEEVMEVMRRQATKKDLGLNSVDGRLAMGAMLVQFLGLYQSLPQLLSELNRSQRDQEKLNEVALGVADSLGGFLGAAAERLAAAHKATLIMKEGGERLVEISGRLAVLRTAAALTGVFGGAINAYLMAKKAEVAGKEGDVIASRSYANSGLSFSLLSATSVVTAADAAAKGAMTRAVAKHLVLRLAGVVATEVAVAGVAATMTSIVSGVGLVLLLIGIGTYVHAVISERDSYQRWAGRCYFGRDAMKRFEKASAETAWFIAIEYEAEAQEDVTRKAQQHPDPERYQPLPSNPMGDGWGGGLQ
ncbi:MULTISPECIES: T6SS effector BTH_I2691 family protein [unclassified Variovorax]|uniref:T6SS effector BTH_I2691 family protein n=1 Tax=unclassified Variovorax TaxID=663243 RepID=UPI0032E6B2F0